MEPIPASRIRIVRGSGIPPQPPALHDYLLGPANKSGAFFTGPAACERARCAGRGGHLHKPFFWDELREAGGLAGVGVRRLHWPQLRGGFFGTAVLRTAVVLQPLGLLSKRKPILRNLFERPFEA